MSKVRCTVVVPMFNEAASLAVLGDRLTRVLDAEGFDWEVLFIDDGSDDGSFAEVQKLHATDGRFKCLRFSRNFGSHVAISAGLEHARGDIAIVTTADLEEPPESIPGLLKMWREGCDLVWGIRARRAERGLSRLGSKAFHSLFRWLAKMGPGQADIGGGLFLANRRVLDAVRRFPERNRNIVGILLWAGFKQGRMVYEPAPRKYGQSKWSFAKKIKLAVDTFVGFSNRPLRLMFAGGGAFGVIGLLAMAIAVVDAAGRGRISPMDIVAAAFGALAISVGVQLTSTGLLGEYLWRSLDEGRSRPLYVLAERLGMDERALLADGSIQREALERI